VQTAGKFNRRLRWRIDVKYAREYQRCQNQECGGGNEADAFHKVGPKLGTIGAHAAQYAPIFAIRREQGISSGDAKAKVVCLQIGVGPGITGAHSVPQ
jgi:hypothetical protein